MLIDAPQASLSIRPGQMVRLDLAAHSRLRGVTGHAWITFDHDRRDIVLGPGEEFVTEGPGHALAGALRGGGQTELWVSA